MHASSDTARLTDAELRAAVTAFQDRSLPYSGELTLYATVCRLVKSSRYRPGVCSASGCDPDSVFQDTVTDCMMALRDNYRPWRGSVTTFTTAVVPKKSSDASRRHSPKGITLSDEQAAATVSREAPILEELERTEEQALALGLVARAVRRLTPRQRKAFFAWRRRLRTGLGKFDKKAKYEAIRKLRGLIRVP